MSRAGNFATAAAQLPERPVWEQNGKRVRVADTGEMDLGSIVLLSPEEALSLADWIKDVFGEF